MPYRQDAFAPGEVYHVYNRGLDGRRIFVQPRNYVYFLQRIKALVAE